MEENNKHRDNVYALDITNVIRHISEIESGKKGYFCQGCGREMQAKKGDIRFHHFSHDPKDVAQKGKCTYSDESYRHMLAKETLQRIKQIKVPAIKKYPALGKEGAVNIIRESWVIYAATVEIEMPFYEDKNGKIIWGRQPEGNNNSERHLLIQPDVAFFDLSGNPILLIEIVATHKIDNDKLFKIRSLGIDAIEVTIPKDSPQEIEKTFHTTARTKWVYNNEQEQTEYKFVPNGDSQGISFADAFEQKLEQAGKSFKCRMFEVSEALRRIRKYLETEQFRNAASTLADDIQRVERNTKRDRKRLRELQGRTEGVLIAELSGETELLGERESDLIDEENRFQRYVSDLENRYHTETRRIASAYKQYRSPSQSEIEEYEGRLRELGGSGESLQDRIAAIESEEKIFEQSISAATLTLEQDIAAEERRLDEQSESTIGQIERAVLRRATFSAEIIPSEASFRSELDQNENNQQSKFEHSEADVRAEFEQLGRISLEAITGRDSKRTPRLNSRIKNLVAAGGLLDSIPKTAIDFRGLRKAKEAFESGSYKSWT